MANRVHVALLIETSIIYGRRLLSGVTRYVRSHEPWSIFLEQRGLAEEPPAWFNEWSGDGMLSRVTTPQMAEQLQAKEIPVVDLTDIYGENGLPGIWSNDREIGRLGAEHLCERGFRHFGFCGFDNHSWSRRRRDGFIAAVAPTGGKISVYESPWGGPEAHQWEAEQAAIAAWLLSLPKPVGIMASNDMRGQHVLDACKRANIAVPEEVAVVGCDNDELLCSLCDPPLSSVMPNAEQIGYEAAELLNQLMASKGKERQLLSQTRRELPPVGVVTRQSTDVLAIEDPLIAAAVKFIRENACRGATVEEVLQHVPLSRSMLERGFRQFIGRSPHAEIRNVQLKRVTQMLAETELPLERIAELSGFKHPEYMSVVFKREVGKTPGDFRKKSRPDK